MIVVHVDADVGEIPTVRAVLADAEDESGSLKPLCDHVKGWFAGGVATNAVVVLPRMATEAWLLAAHSHVVRPESVEDPAKALADRQLIPSEQGTPVKNSEDYERLSDALVRLIRRRSIERLPELERFLDKLRVLRRTQRRTAAR